MDKKGKDGDVVAIRQLNYLEISSFMATIGSSPSAEIRFSRLCHLKALPQLTALGALPLVAVETLAEKVTIHIPPFSSRNIITFD
jgi:hypothetical protein